LSPALKLGLSWVTALVLAMSAMAVLSWREDLVTRDSLAGMRTVFLGTSLFRYAITNGEPAFPDARKDLSPYLRLGLSSGNEADLLKWAQRAEAAGTETLFIEVNPLVARFANVGPGCGIIWRIGQVRARVWRLAHGWNDVPRITRNEQRTPKQGQDALPNAERYPLRIYGPCYLADWQSVASGEMHLVFVLMPRSPAARELVGREDSARFLARAEALAETLGTPLIVVDPDEDWEQEYFRDSVHMTVAGAERFRHTIADFLGGAR